MFRGATQKRADNATPRSTACNRDSGRHLVSLILVVDDNSVYRSGLRSVIETRVQGSRVLEANKLQSLLDHIETDPPFDLVLIDAKSLGEHSLALLKEVHERSPTTRFAVMSTSNTRVDVVNCLSAGFHGFIYKLQSDEELLAAISDLLSGRIYVPRWLADTTVPLSVNLKGSPFVNPDTDILRLTPRQHEVLSLLAKGMSTKEISRRLNIAEGTTKIHTSGLLRALGARNRTEAAAKAANLVDSKTQRIFIEPSKKTEK
jgi:DNA-binding NarL/FixJ family response regulator